MKKFKLFALTASILFVGINAFAQTRKALDESKVYYITINGFALADNGVDFDSETAAIDEVFTGDARPTIEQYKEGAWSQLWYFEDKGDSYTIINYKTDRYVWTDARLPKVGDVWNLKDWDAMPSDQTDRLLYFGPSGVSVSLSGWNNFKITENDDTGGISFTHVWGDAIYKGYFLPDSETAGSFISMPKTENYAWEITEAYSKSEVPPDVPTSIAIQKQAATYEIINNTVVSSGAFKVYTVDGSFITSSSTPLNAGIYVVKFSTGQVEKVIIR